MNWLRHEYHETLGHFGALVVSFLLLFQAGSWLHTWHVNRPPKKPTVQIYGARTGVVFRPRVVIRRSYRTD